MWSTWRNQARTTEEQLAALRQQIEAAEANLVDREAELADLRVEMHAFQLKYEVLVGRKLEALSKIEDEIKRCKKRISDYRQWGARGRPRTPDGREFVPVEEQYRRTWQDPPPPQPWFPPPPISAAAAQDLKSLYRQLCRRFHPDLTQDPQERAWRTEMMAAVNAAYDAQSLAELQALAAKPARRSARDAGPGADRERLEALRERLRHIRSRIREAEQEIYDLTHGSLVEMSLEVKLAARDGQDLLAEMSAEVEQVLERKRAELDFLRAQLRQLGILSPYEE
jgi:predicted  nucleic acid-binding Zn-ribbon protein